jgi:Caspase domain
MRITVRPMRPSSGTSRRSARKDKAPLASSTIQGMVRRPDTKINYLIPVDVANAEDEELWNYSINLNTLVENLRAQAPGATHYVVFDACRNELNLTRRGQKALTEKGFVPMAYTPGVLVAYATAPGRTASDRGTDGGTYAKALADEIMKPGVDSMLVFSRVARRVQHEIGQDPFLSASTVPEIYFAGAPNSASPSPAPQVSRSELERAWEFIKQTDDQAQLEAFIKQFGDSAYAPMARARLEELRKRHTAVLSPSVNKPTSNTPDKPRGAFDGNWQIQWYDASGCSDPHALFSLTVSNDAISSGGERPITGRVDKTGNITFSRPGRIVKGATLRYVGQLRGNSGSGRFTGAGRCAGRFAATRQ